MQDSAYTKLKAAAHERQLCVLGGVHRSALADLPGDVQTLILLGPDEPQFWPAFAQSNEACDGAPNPMDRWSRRVVGDLARTMGAQPYYPFDGPPWHPFYTWALATGRCHASPVPLLVHDTAGLFASFRGALGFAEHLELPAAPPAPCDTCAKRPCRAACPVDALTDQGYDIDRCRAYLGTSAGKDCMDRGCAARRACPVSGTWGRIDAQSAFHMQAFHPS